MSHYDKDDPYNRFCNEVSSPRDNSSNPNFVLQQYGISWLKHIAVEQSKGNEGHNTMKAWQFLRLILGHPSEFGRLELTLHVRESPESIFFEIQNGVLRPTGFIAIFHSPEVSEELGHSGTMFQRRDSQEYVKRFTNRRIYGDAATAKYLEILDRLGQNRPKKRSTVFLKKS